MVVTRCQPWRWWLWGGGYEVWWCDKGDGVAWMVMMTMVRWCGDDGDDDGDKGDMEMVVVRGMMGWPKI
ncbi:hypothetical protein Tco_0400241 [Tanacetum coccineum]